MELSILLQWLREIAPETSALPKDPVGLLIHGSDDPVTSVVVCLDITPSIAEEAAKTGAQLIVCHHPLLYNPLRRIDLVDPIFRVTSSVIRARQSVYAMHTNWDAAAGGINDTLATVLKLSDVICPATVGPEVLLRVGNLPQPMSPYKLAGHVQGSLGCEGSSALRWIEDGAPRAIERVAVCGGAGAFLMQAAMDAGAQAFVTSDVRHHEYLDAAGRGLLLFDAGHAATETPGMRELARRIGEQFAELSVTFI